MAEINKTDALRHIFDGTVRRKGQPTGAAKWRVGNDIYYISKCCVFKGIANRADLELPNNVKTKYSEHIKLVEISDLRTTEASVMLKQDHYDLPMRIAKQADAYLMVVNNPPNSSAKHEIWVMQEAEEEDTLRLVERLNADSHAELFDKFPAKLSHIPTEISSMLQDYELTDDDISIQFTLHWANPMTMLYMSMKDGSGWLYGAITASNSKFKAIYDQNGSVYIGMRWTDKDGAFNSITTKRSMDMTSALSDPTRRKQTVTAAAAVAKADVREADVQQAVHAQVDGGVKPAEPVTGALPCELDTELAAAAVIAGEPKEQPAVNKDAEAPVPVQQVPEAKPVQAVIVAAAEEPKVEDKKPKKVKPVKAVGDLSAAVPPVTEATYDKALDEVRALRDLQIATARRLANITIEMHKASKTAMEAVAAIQGVLKK